MITTTKKCPKCGTSKPINEFSKDKSKKDGKYTCCKECHKEMNKNWYENGGREKAGCQSMYENKSCAQYLGVVIAERLIKHLFNDVEVMPFGFPGYDFICNKGKKINAKASTTYFRENKNSSVEFWYFSINKNKGCDFFLCIAFDSVNNPTPLHIWMIPAQEVNDRVSIQISSSTIHKWNEWKMDVDDAQSCCAIMKEKKTEGDYN